MNKSNLLSGVCMLAVTGCMHTTIPYQTTPALTQAKTFEKGPRWADKRTAAKSEIKEHNIPKTTAPIMTEAKKKPNQPWKFKETYTVAQLKDYTQSADPEYSRYGGIKSSQYPATGFFYTKKVNDRWWLIDPDGHLFIHKAICSVSPGGSDNFQKNFNQIFGTDEHWAESTAVYLKELGFNGTAAWSKNELLAKTQNRPVYTQKWSFMSSYAKQRGIAKMGTGNHNYTGNVIPVFEPDFVTFADNYAKTKLAATKDDPYLLGHFSDNEMPLRVEALENSLKLDKETYGYKAALKWMQQRKGKQNITLDDITIADKDEFLGFYIEKYLSIVTTAIKKYDPNHLYLGFRMIRVTNHEKAMRAYSKYADVMTMNWYGAWMLEKWRMDNWGKWTNKPFIISEWYAKGHDVPNLTNESGAGWLVKTQKERGYYYQNMVLNLMANKNSVGWHWFKYADNDPDNLKTDPSNRNSNKGIVNVKYRSYTDLVDAMKQVNNQVYRIIEFFDDTSYSGE